MPSTLRHTLVRPTLQSLVARGPVATVRSLLRRLGLPVAAVPLDPYPPTAPISIHPYDSLHHVDTSGYIRADRLHTRTGDSTPLHGSALWSTAYYPIAPSLFDQALSLLAVALRQTAPTLATDPFAPFTFLDLGCGKGRALLLASRYPFRSIHGIELDPDLASTAQQNLQTFRDPAQRCHNLAARHADAACPTLFNDPGLLAPTVLFLYHPFLAPVLRRVLHHLTRSLALHPRPLWLLYLNPEPLPVFHDFPAFHEQTRTLLHITPEDDLPDRLGIRTEELAILRHEP